MNYELRITNYGAVNLEKRRGDLASLREDDWTNYFDPLITLIYAKYLSQRITLIIRIKVLKFVKFIRFIRFVKF